MSDISSSLLGQRPSEKSLIQKQEPFWKQLLLGSVEAAGQGAGAIAPFLV
jgi:hypothetical protein